MTKEDIKNYIRLFLNDTDVERELEEIPNAILLLVVYATGLQAKPFPLDLIGKEDALKIEEEFPPHFHKLIAKLSIKKSKIEQRNNTVAIIGNLTGDMKFLLEEFRNYYKFNQLNKKELCDNCGEEDLLCEHNGKRICPQCWVLQLKKQNEHRTKI